VDLGLQNFGLQRKNWASSKVLPLNLLVELVYPFPKTEREEWPMRVPLTVPRNPPTYVDDSRTESIRKGYAIKQEGDVDQDGVIDEVY